MPSTTTLGRAELGAGDTLNTRRDRQGSAAPRSAPSRLVFVGPLETDAYCGSTVKNKLMVAGLTQAGVDVEVVDTGESGRRERFGQLGQLLRALVSNRQVVVSASRNGVYTLVPLLGALSVILPRLRYAILVTGSGLPRHVSRLSGQKQRFFRWSLSRATGIFSEGDWINRELQKVGLHNSSYLPNPRPRPAARWNPAALQTGRLTYISRVIPEKGVESAIEAVDRLRAEGLEVSLDIYGPVPATYKDRFEKIVAESAGTTYHGVLEPDTVVDTLASQAGLVFPTTLMEGMPGILVEAAMVGMPVVSTTLTPIAEFMVDGESGLLVEPNDTDALTGAIRRLLTKPEETVRMAEALGRRVDIYSLDNVAEQLCRELVEQGWR